MSFFFNFVHSPNFWAVRVYHLRAAPCVLGNTQHLAGRVRAPRRPRHPVMLSQRADQKYTTEVLVVYF